MASVIVPAAIAGAATLGGAAMGGKGAKAAARAQQQSQAAALQFAMQQEATRKSEYDRAEAARAAAWQAEEQRKAPYRAALESVARGLGAKFGVDIPSAASYGSAAPPPGWQPGQSTAPATSGRQPLGMAALLSDTYAPQTAPITPPRLTLADLLSRDEIPRQA